MIETWKYLLEFNLQSGFQSTYMYVDYREYYERVDNFID